MPLYEYRCNACSKPFEEIATANEAVPCPSCKSTDTARLLSACAHQGCKATLGNYSPTSGGGGGCGGCTGGNCASCK